MFSFYPLSLFDKQCKVITLGNYNIIYYSSGKNVLFVSFQPYSKVISSSSLSRPWGFNFYSKHFDVLGITKKISDWYLGNELQLFFLSKVYKNIISKYKKIYLIGSSMGGFAALTYARVGNCSNVIAFSPQTTLHHAKTPWDKRSGNCPQYIDWHSYFGDAADGGGVKNYIIYDQFVKVDLAHAQRLQNAIHLTIPFSGHKTVELLNEVGMLKKIILLIVNESLTKKGFYTLQKEKRKSTIYYKNLLRYTKKEKIKYFCMKKIDELQK